MSFISTFVHSKTLNQRVPVSIFLPNDVHRKTLKGVVYFLPGITQSQEDFQLYTSANRYALENQLAIVYVSAPYSFYQDMDCGFNYFTYITEELPILLGEMFNIPKGRDKTFIAGLSMGGYGALLLALSRPDLYSACASFSGCLDMHGMLSVAENIPEYKAILSPAFGQKLQRNNNSDLFYLVKQISGLEPLKQPRLFICCGKQDHNYQIYEQNQKFNHYAQSLNLAQYKYMQWNGAHTFDFWDRAMLHAVAFFRQNNYDEKKLKLWRD